MASGVGWTKKCRKCGKQRQKMWFPAQTTRPGQLPMCQTCMEERNATTNGK